MHQNWKRRKKHEEEEASLKLKSLHWIKKIIQYP